MLTYPEQNPYSYKASHDLTVRERVGHPWSPSIHMPREAARLFLVVTDVRVERVQDISEKDVVAEGIKVHVPVPGDGDPMPVLQFKRLWESIYGPKGMGWDQNPWVWVIEFEKIEKP